jgi:hypothetical protein
MKGFFWTDGRLSWPVIAIMAYLTTSVVIADYLWRMVVIPFNSLLVYALATAVGLPGVFLLLRHFLMRRIP